MKLDRYFYSISAVVFVLITFWGFHSFYLYAKAAGGNPIAPEMFGLDSIHGAAMSARLFPNWVAPIKHKVSPLRR